MLYCLNFSMGLHCVIESVRLSADTGFDWLPVKFILYVVCYWLTCAQDILERGSLSVCIQVNI